MVHQRDVEGTFLALFGGGSMGIKFLCPNGHKLNVKAFLAGKKGVCPDCGERFLIPLESIPQQRVVSIGVSSAAGGSDDEGEMATSHAAQATPDVAAYHAAMGSAVAGAPSSHFASGPASIAAPTAPPTAAPTAAPTADPLEEAPNAAWYVRPPSGGQYGPAKGDLLRRWITEGRVSADSLVWREGWPEWKQAGGLLPGVGGGAAPGLVAPDPVVPTINRPGGVAQMVGSPAGAAAGPALLTNPAITSSPSPSSSASPTGYAAKPNAYSATPTDYAGAAGAAASLAGRSNAAVSRKPSRGGLALVILLAVSAVAMLVALVWVILSN